MSLKSAETTAASRWRNERLKMWSWALAVDCRSATGLAPSGFEASPDGYDCEAGIAPPPLPGVNNGRLTVSVSVSETQALVGRAKAPDTERVRGVGEVSRIEARAGQTVERAS